MRERALAQVLVLAVEPVCDHARERVAEHRENDRLVDVRVRVE